MPDKIKEAFNKIKQEMEYLKREIILLQSQISQVYSFLNQVQESNASQAKTQHIEASESIELSNNEQLSLNLQSSIGNKGVPTDKQTNRQTINTQQTGQLKRTLISKDIVDDLKAFQRKFQNLTKQEFLIFSTLYILSNEKKQVTYRDISMKTKLSESSVRDYILRLLRKGVPIARAKLNNKQIVLDVPRDFKELVPLDILVRMRLEDY
ncbi:MAG: hypothetical protein QXP53_01815 [Candidatus Pacearchaeota archaeon]